MKIVFDRKDITQDEIESIISGIAGCTDCFEIKDVGSEGDKVTVIIRFDQVSEAKNFVDAISADSTNDAYAHFTWLDEPRVSAAQQIVPRAASFLSFAAHLFF